MPNLSLKKLARPLFVVAALAFSSYLLYPAAVEKLTLFRLQKSGYHFYYFQKKDAYVCSVTPWQMLQLEDTNSYASKLVSNLTGLGYRIEITEIEPGPPVKLMTIYPTNPPERKSVILPHVQKETPQPP